MKKLKNKLLSLIVLSSLAFVSQTSLATEQLPSEQIFPPSVFVVSTFQSPSGEHCQALYAFPGDRLTNGAQWFGTFSPESSHLVNSNMVVFVAYNKAAMTNELSDWPGVLVSEISTNSTGMHIKQRIVYVKAGDGGVWFEVLAAANSEVSPQLASNVQSLLSSLNIEIQASESLYFGLLLPPEYLVSPYPTSPDWIGQTNTSIPTIGDTNNVAPILPVITITTSNTFDGIIITCPTTMPSPVATQPFTIPIKMPVAPGHPEYPYGMTAEQYIEWLKSFMPNGPHIFDPPSLPED